MSEAIGFTVADCDECHCGPNSHHYPGCSHAPYVCPGCHAVGGERCAPDCIDAQIEREREEERDFDRDDLNGTDDFEVEPW